MRGLTRRAHRLALAAHAGVPVVRTVHGTFVVRRLVHPAIILQLLPSKTEHRVAALVIQLVLAVLGLGRPRDVVVLGNTHTATQQVTGGGAGVHGELARVDDVEPTVRREVGPLGQTLGAVGAVRDVVGLLRRHGELRGQRTITKQKAGRLRAPRLERVFGVFN